MYGWLTNNNHCSHTLHPPTTHPSLSSTLKSPTLALPVGLVADVHSLKLQHPDLAILVSLGGDSVAGEVG